MKGDANVWLCIKIGDAQQKTIYQKRENHDKTNDAKIYNVEILDQPRNCQAISISVALQCYPPQCHPARLAHQREHSANLPLKISKSAAKNIKNLIDLQWIASSRRIISYAQFSKSASISWVPPSFGDGWSTSRDGVGHDSWRFPKMRVPPNHPLKSKSVKKRTIHFDTFWPPYESMWEFYDSHRPPRSLSFSSWFTPMPS